MSYFNFLSGGPQHGHQHLLDANIDWGQDLRELKRWIDDKDLSEPLSVSCFGPVDPKFAGIDAPPVPSLLFDDQGHVVQGDLNDLRVGWYAVSINHLMGYRHQEKDRPQWRWLQEFTPVERAGYSIWIYHLTDPDVKAFQQKRRSHGGPVFPDVGGQLGYRVWWSRNFD